MTDLTEISCPHCGHKAREVVYAEKNIRRGWYCPHCGKFTKAEWRERLVTP